MEQALALERAIDQPSFGRKWIEFYPLELQHGNPAPNNECEQIIQSTDLDGWLVQPLSIYSTLALTIYSFEMG